MASPIESNPWFSMWTQPRATVRAILQTNPTYGFWILSTLFGLTTLLFFGNFNSWGFFSSFTPIIFLILLLSPLVGYVWLSVDACILKYIGSKMGGPASFFEVRTALAWSKVPFFISFLTWVILIVSGPNSAFIQYATGTSAVFIILISLIINTWSFVLLFQGIREVQSFDLKKACINVFLAYFIFLLVAFVLALAVRFILFGLV